MKKAPGILPSPEWLRKNGYSGLQQAMLWHPEAFAHIRQHKKIGLKPGEWVPIAETLAEMNGGQLPFNFWLRKHGYFGLTNAIYYWPELFSHIRQEHRGGHTKKEHIIRAEILARKHNGILPNPEWLRKHGEGGLVHAMWKYPELFAHVVQQRRRKQTLEDWVPEAESLARQHGGELPHGAWLAANGFRGLCHAIRNRPELFSHITQQRKWRTSEEWMIVAKELIHKYGKLPCAGWLQENGYRSLYEAMHRHPELFASMKA